MLLNNYYALLTAAAFGEGSAQITDYWDIKYPVRAEFADLDLRPGRVLESITGGDGVIFGTGTTAPSIEDSALSGSIVYNSDNNISFTTEGPIETENGLKYTATYTITNINDYALTIGEVGMIRKVYNSKLNGPLYILVERTALDEPIVISAGGVGRVVYTINLSVPTA
jgi:hypothetical protein